MAWGSFIMELSVSSDKGSYDDSMLEHQQSVDKRDDKQLKKKHIWETLKLKDLDHNFFDTLPCFP